MNFIEQQEFDVLIIGGGIIGLSIARELKKNSVERVAIIEKNSVCGAEASAAAAGMLAPQAETDQADDFLCLCQESRHLYPKLAAELFDETGIGIELEQTGALFLAFFEADLRKIEKRFAWQKAANLPIEKLSAKDVLNLEPNLSPQVLGALRFPLDWQVENRLLVSALLQSQKNVCLYRDEIKRLEIDADKIWRVQGLSSEFRASRVVVASGAWSSLIEFPFEFKNEIKITPIRGQMMSFQFPDKLLSHVIHTQSGYLVPRRDNRILVGATVEDVGFSEATGSAAMNHLLEVENTILPNRNSNNINHWFNFRPKSPDGLPLLGEYPAGSGLYFATGHYRNGILLAPVTAKLIADKITKNIDSPFLKIFNPSRFANHS